MMIGRMVQKSSASMELIMAFREVKELLAEIDVYPYHGSVLVEDAGESDPDTQIVPNGRQWGDPGSVSASQHSIQVVTISADIVDGIGRDVAVRVYRRGSESGLGTLIFDGCLNLTVPALAIGELLAESEFLRRVDVGHTGRTRIQIFAQNTVPELQDEPDSPTDLNILVD